MNHTSHTELVRAAEELVGDAAMLLAALERGERPDTYSGYGRDGQATNYRDELKASVKRMKSLLARAPSGGFTDAELIEFVTKPSLELTVWCGIRRPPSREILCNALQAQKEAL